VHRGAPGAPGPGARRGPASRKMDLERRGDMRRGETSEARPRVVGQPGPAHHPPPFPPPGLAPQHVQLQRTQRTRGFGLTRLLRGFENAGWGPGPESAGR